MAFKRDDDNLAEAVLALCNAIEDGGTNAEARQGYVNEARKCAQNVLSRGKKKQDKQPDEPAERKPE